MSPDLARDCRDFVLSVAFRDDCVTHFSPQALAGLHARLCGFDWRAAAKVGLALMLCIFPELAAEDQITGRQAIRKEDMALTSSGNRYLINDWGMEFLLGRELRTEGLQLVGCVQL